MQPGELWLGRTGTTVRKPRTGRQCTGGGWHTHRDRIHVGHRGLCCLQILDFQTGRL